MKTFISALLFWLLTLTGAAADSPRATLDVTPLNPGQWPAQFRITVDVPPDHHAYLNAGDKNIYIPIAFDADGKLAAAGLAITQIQKPAGEYDPDMAAQVLRGRGEFTLALAPTGTVPVSGDNIPLAVRYQLCSDVNHVCFRPKTVTVALPLPPPSAVQPTGGDDAQGEGFMAQLLALFQNHKDNTIILFSLMFIAGLLSVATPCVYPMLPITSMFIINRANGVAKKERQHALVYWLGIVGTYMLLGLVAGMTGGAFNTFMQSAWVNLAFAVFFGFFALALLGFYELAFMQNEVHSLDQQSARVKGLAGTWLMGTVAGLVISPCVGPIVFALLLQVADNIADRAAALAAMGQVLDFWERLRIAASGSVMMAGFGVGVGIPFFVVSVVKLKLPKAGHWMNAVKYAFGFIILYFAYTYFDKGLGVLGAKPATSLAMAFGMVAIWLAVVHCNVLTLLPQDAPPNQKMHQYCGVMLLLIGGWLTLASLGQLPFAHPAVAVATAGHTPPVAAGATPATEEEAGITWHRSYAAAQKLAQQSGKPVFVDFYASWCANCKEFKEETAQNAALNAALRDAAIAVKLVDQEPEFEYFRNHPEHRPLKIGLPYFAIFGPDGELAWSGTDYKATEKMISVLTKKQLDQNG